MEGESASSRPSARSDGREVKSGESASTELLLGLGRFFFCPIRSQLSITGDNAHWPVLLLKNEQGQTCPSVRASPPTFV